MPFWGAYEVVTCAQGKAPGFKSCEVFASIDNSNDDSDDWYNSADHANDVQARRLMSGVRVGGEYSTVKTRCMKYLPRGEDAVIIKRTAALFANIRLECRMEIDWIADMMLDELVDFLCSFAKSVFDGGYDGVVGYLSDILMGCNCQWMKWLGFARVAAFLGSDCLTKNTSMNICTDGKCSFLSRCSLSEHSRSLCLEYVWSKNSDFCEKMRSRKEAIDDFDVDTIYGSSNFDKIATEMKNCRRFANFVPVVWDVGDTHPRNEDVSIIMQKDIPCTYQVSGIEAWRCLRFGSDGCVLIFDTGDNFSIHLRPKPRRTIRGWRKLSLPLPLCVGFVPRSTTDTVSSQTICKQVRVDHLSDMSPDIDGWSVKISQTHIDSMKSDDYAEDIFWEMDSSEDSKKMCVSLIDHALATATIPEIFCAEEGLLLHFVECRCFYFKGTQKYQGYAHDLNPSYGTRASWGGEEKVVQVINRDHYDDYGFAEIVLTKQDKLLSLRGISADKMKQDVFMHTFTSASENSDTTLALYFEESFGYFVC
jgi:hypothetical protein